MTSDVTVIDLPYLAPVPVGHEVLVLELANAAGGFFELNEAGCVVDRQTRVMYADRSYLTSLAKNTTPNAFPIDAPADVLGPGWTVSRSFAGQVVCALVGTADGMTTTTAKTRLYLRSAPTTTYR